MGKFGVRGRLLLAFLGISGFSVLAAAAGLYAFRQVGGRLDLIDARVPQVVSSMDVSRSAERIIAAAPALLAATTPRQRDEVSARMRPEIDSLVAALEDLKRAGTAREARASVEPLIGSLRSNLVDLDGLVARRLEASGRLGDLLRDVFETNDETQRLFAPLLQVMDSEVSRALANAARQGAGPGGQAAARELAALVAAERPHAEALRSFSSAVDLATRTATVEDSERLPVLAFQLRRGIEDMQRTAAGLDSKMRPLFVAEVAKLHRLAVGPGAIPEIRGKELELIGRAEKLIAENAVLSERLTAAVDRLVEEAATDIRDSTDAAMSVQHLSAQVLLVAAVLSLLSSIAIVWIYVSRNLIRRLMRLNDGMVAIVDGRQHKPIDIPGADEVAAMGRVVEIFRKNTLERDQLLAERAEAATRLERVVEERTAELARREAALRVMFDSMSQGVAMFDGERKLVAWNRRFGDLFPLPDGLMRGSTRFDDFIRVLAEGRELGVGNVDEIVRERVAAADQPFHAERTRPDGTVLDVRRNPVPGGGFISMYADITEMKRREQELEAARDAADTAYMELKAAQANLVHAEKMASLGQLTAGIAHEIKNPLNFVNNFASLSGELLAELREALAATDPSRRAEVEDVMATLSGNLAKIVEHGRRADGIVKSMLLHSRGGSVERQTVDFNALVEEALNLAYHGARAQDQNFNVTLERDLESAIGKIEVVPQDLTRVFLNLLGNSFYATNKRARDGAGPNYRPTVKVTTRGVPDAIEVRVCDNGVGMSADVRKKLFTPFFTTKPTGEGTGLGLSISYDIVVQQHNGTMVVESAPGEYTEFIIRLPRSVALDNVRRALGGSA